MWKIILEKIIQTESYPKEWKNRKECKRPMTLDEKDM